MKTAKQLLVEFLPLFDQPEKAAQLFAEDGAIELPYLSDLGMPARYSGRAEIVALFTLLRELVPNWTFRDLVIQIETDDKVFAEYKVDELTANTARPFKQHFFGYLHAENGKIKLLRESLNIVATARAFFPNGLADIPAQAA